MMRLCMYVCVCVYYVCERERGKGGRTMRAVVAENWMDGCLLIHC